MKSLKAGHRQYWRILDISRLFGSPGYGVTVVVDEATEKLVQLKPTDNVPKSMVESNVWRERWRQEAVQYMKMDLRDVHGGPV